MSLPRRKVVRDVQALAPNQFGVDSGCRLRNNLWNYFNKTEGSNYYLRLYAFITSGKP